MQKPQERVLKLTLSPSRVGMYEQCPRRYYYRYIERLPTKDWPHFNLGTFVHGALENFHKRELQGDKDPPAAIMKTACADFYRKMDRDGKELTAAQIDEAKTMLANYMQRLVAEERDSEILALEDKFTVRLNDDYDLTGVVDRLDRDKDGILHIKDYKTNKSAKYMKPFQLNAYGIYLLDKFPDTKRFRASYIMLRLNGQPITFDFTREDVDKCRRKLIEAGDKITQEERWITKAGRLCDWCDFKEVCFNSW